MMAEKTIEEMLNDGESKEKIIDAEYTEVEAPAEEKRISILDNLLCKTGEGEVYDYLDHPLNIIENEHGARIIRGLTGIFGELDFALLDIAIGILGIFNGKGKVAHE